MKNAAKNYYLYKVVTNDSFKVSFEDIVPIYQELYQLLQIESEPISIKKGINLKSIVFKAVILKLPIV